MPRKLDPRIVNVLRELDFSNAEITEGCWDCHGTWVMYHKFLERVQAKAGITFNPPQIIEANAEEKIVSMCVAGRRDDVTEWSIGEAAPYNNKNAYPYAMAEKRAKDRVILKLIGLHGLTYSEDEADDFKADGQTYNAAPDTKGKSFEECKAEGIRMNSSMAKKEGIADNINNSIDSANTVESLDQVWDGIKEFYLDHIPENWIEPLTEKYENKREALRDG